MLTLAPIADAPRFSGQKERTKKPKFQKPRYKALLHRISIVGRDGRLKSDLVTVGPYGELAPTSGFVNWVAKRMAKHASVEISGFHRDTEYNNLLGRLYHQARQRSLPSGQSRPDALAPAERVLEFMGHILTGVKASPVFPTTPSLALNSGFATRGSAELISKGFISEVKREARMAEIARKLAMSEPSPWGGPVKALTPDEIEALKLERDRIQAFAGQLELDGVLNRKQCVRIENRATIRVPTIHLDSAPAMIGDSAVFRPTPLLGLYYGTPENLDRRSGVQLFDVGRALKRPKSENLTGRYTAVNLPFDLNAEDSRTVEAAVDKDLPGATAGRLVQLPSKGSKILLIPNGQGHIGHASAEHRRIDNQKGFDKPFLAMFA